MPKITFMGAGSIVFAQNIIGDCMLAPSLCGSHFALYDIDAERLRDSKMMLDNLNKNVNQNRATITTHLGVKNRKSALNGANYVVNAIQVGGYKPSTVIDFDIPNKYGLRQTIADTLGIGGIFRGLRTIPVVLDFARDMEEVCPDAWFLNYVNPMSIITGALQRGTNIKTVGLCHSVQDCASGLLRKLDLDKGVKNLQWKIAGINHQAWLLEITDGGTDLYPKIKKRAKERTEAVMKRGIEKIRQEIKKQKMTWWDHPDSHIASDLVRLEIMRQFGYYVTESSEHNSEYMPYWIKSNYPELIEKFNIPLDEYPRRCVGQIAGWKKMRDELVHNKALSHARSHEFGSYIIEAMETDVPIRIAGNVQNKGFIPNLPSKACVEVPCLIDRNGVQGCYAGELPEQCAGLNRSCINVQLLTIEAALTKKKEAIYHAAMLDPHTAAELPLDKIRNMVDDLIAAHGKMLPQYK